MTRQTPIDSRLYVFYAVYYPGRRAYLSNTMDKPDTHGYFLFDEPGDAYAYAAKLQADPDSTLHGIRFSVLRPKRPDFEIRQKSTSLK